MEKELLEIPVTLLNGDTVKIHLSSKKEKTLFYEPDNEIYEAPFQICEGNIYDYQINDAYSLSDPLNSGIVSPSKFKPFVGTISPNIYVGTLTLDVLDKSNNIAGIVKLEVRSVKTDYKKDYRKMLSDITEQSVELIFRLNMPVTQTVEPDYKNDPKTLHQNFAFVKSVLDNDEFYDSVNKVVTSPVTKWIENETVRDTRSIKKAGSKILRQVSSASNRIPVYEEHHLITLGIKTVPVKIRFSEKTETVDTPENRFVKYVLNQFLFFVSHFVSHFVSFLEEDNKTKLEALAIESYLEQTLGHSIFKEISEPETIILNSPVLQRKEGYREILKIWLMFGLAAQLSWEGGEDVYNIEKRDVATLYEYWLFFELLKIVEKTFGITPKSDLIVNTNDKLDLKLKQGKTYFIEGVCIKYSRHLKIKFSYNRSFGGNSGTENYPIAGSWTRNMRPDYTLSIWPAGIEETQAEEEEFIVHVHFDAKYKIEKILESLGDADLDKEKQEQNRGTYKRADLLKMHSYKDAIRRTGGAYILYPGTGESAYEKRGFRELLPGLGAFQVRPSLTGDTGATELEKFFDDIVIHFMDRTSQREKTAYRIFDIHKDEPSVFQENKIVFNEKLEHTRNSDEIYVIVGYYNPSQLSWIEDKNLYNLRTNNFILSSESVGAKYLLLHSKNELESGRLYLLKNVNPEIISKPELKKKYKYPSDNTNLERTYLLFEIENKTEELFPDIKWNIRKLEKYRGGNLSGKPFIVTLKELMESAIK